ncbi:unnamed protein product [Anisakis simplex]|uniref:Kinesin-like protein Nod (inferred by orthology to a D. melanogaster protein) n=1 Tax=Anisakis simplex TaxID=6269 RepID=A0A0M3K7F5_ANISI|nr:unnamed protein product [Anisakis simplex]
MKEEEAKFRKWKTKADHEMMQMKSRERKREFETARAQRMSAQQLAVYRRKYEEAIACNRRLQQQLVKSSSSKRNDKKMSSELINYLDNELRMAIWTAEARWHCDVLIEQRKTLSEQLKKKKEHLSRLNKEPPKKKHVGSDRTGSDNNSELRQLEREIAGLQQEISSYNIEIHDAQADCMKADEREDQRWLGIDSTVNIKSVLKHLFEAAVNQRKMALEKEQEMDDAKRLLQEENKVKEEQIKELKSNLKHEQNTIKTIQERLTRRELDFDETTMNIINMYDADENTVNVDVLKRLERVMNSMNRISELQESVTAKEEQIKEEHVDEDDSDMDISVSFTDDSSDVTYVPPGPSRRTSKRPTKRSIEELGTDGMNATFVIDSNVPGESKANNCPERDNDGANHKENIELVEPITSSSKNAPRKSTEDCGIPQTVLTTNPAKLKARKKRRPGKALSKEPDDLAKTVHEIFAKLT